MNTKICTILLSVAVASSTYSMNISKAIPVPPTSTHPSEKSNFVLEDEVKRLFCQHAALEELAKPNMRELYKACLQQIIENPEMVHQDMPDAIKKFPLYVAILHLAQGHVSWAMIRAFGLEREKNELRQKEADPSVERSVVRELENAYQAKFSQKLEEFPEDAKSELAIRASIEAAKKMLDFLVSMPSMTLVSIPDSH